MSPLLHRWLRNIRGTDQKADTIREDEWGGQPIEDSAPSAESQRMRVVFGNIHGLQLGTHGRDDNKVKSICQEIQYLEIDHLGLVEINCDTCNFNVVDCIKKTVKTALSHVVIQMATSPLKAHNAFKPGGCLSLAHNDVTGRVAATGQDPMGRWSFIKYRGKERRVLTVISAYQVCSSTSDSKTTTFSQQEVLLRQEGRADTNPRRNFRQDLISFLTQCKTKGESIILMGDFNENLVKNDWLTSLNDLGLVDIIASQHPATTNIVTYQGGKSRLDYAFISQDIADSVSACGYFPFRSNFQSDHRFLYLDLDLVKCLGSVNHALGQAALRDFTPKDPKALRHYLKLKQKYLKEHNFFHRLTLLLESDSYDPILLEELDKTLTTASLVAGNKCRRKRRHWFSLPLHAAIEKKMALQTLLTGFHKAKDVAAMRRVAEDRLKAVKIVCELPNTLQEAKIQLKKATKEIRTIVKDSKGARRQFLEDKATEMCRNGNISHQKALESLLQGEKQAEQWSRIKRALRSDTMGAISSIDVPESWPDTEDAFLAENIEDPKKCSRWRTIDTPKEIEFYIRMRNRLHFGQAQGTPFTIPPLREHIDWAANSKVSELILEGEFHDEELGMLEQLLLQHCKRESDTTIANEISKEEFRAKLKVWDERTTTSPSGLHLGHAKALVTPIRWETDEDKEMIDVQSALFEAHLSILNYALKYGHSLDRWKTVVNVMIEKDPGNAKIHRLRVIHLYEFDFGAVLGILWRKMMNLSEYRGTINDGQFGGRKGREAKDLAFLEELKTDICYASRKPLLNFDNDAASCYDRIIPSLASLIARSKGLHYNIAMIHASTLELAKFKLKTALGVSEEEYSHCMNFPIYGTGQGSTNSPIIWIIISSKLFDLHQRQAYGATFATPDKQVEVAFSIVGFVDDSNCQTNKFLLDSTVPDEDLIAMAEYDAKHWSRLLWLSGGYLEIQKCSYHLISFDFGEDGAPAMKGGLVGSQICVKDEVLQRENRIPAKSVFDPHKTLGHFKAPAGRSQTQAEALKSKADTLATRMMKFPCTHAEARLTYQAMYLGWASYSLGQCILLSRDLRRIETKVSSAFMIKCGFARTMPLPIRFGPRRLGGIGQVRLMTLQGEGQIQNFVKHWRADSTPGRVAKCAVAWGQLQAGIGASIFSDTSTPLPHLEQRLIKSTRDFLASIDAKIELFPTFVPPVLRESDYYIMDFAISCGQFSPKQLRLINYCRLHLQATTVAELVEPGGRFLESAAILCHGDRLPSVTTFLKVNQPRPATKFCKPWRHLCHLMSEKLRKERLGQWTTVPASMRRQWNMYLGQGMTRLLVKENGEFLVYSQKEEGVYEKMLTDSGIPSIPEGAVPIRGETLRNGNIRVDMESYVGIRKQRRLPTSETFDEYVFKLPQWEKELLSNVTFVSGGPFETFDRFEQVKTDSETVLTLVGDGSGGEGSMSFGWTLSLPDGLVMVEGAGPAHGAFESSYRSEGYAFLAGVRFIYRWYEFCNKWPKWKVMYYADNASILQKIKEDMSFPSYWPNTTLETEWDIRNEIRHTIRLLECELVVQHVKGHQDSHTAFDELSTISKLNVRADELAGNFRRWNNHVRPYVPRLESNHAQLVIGEATITGGYRQSIRDAACEKDLVQYTCEKFHWSAAQYDSVDWRAFSSAITKMPHRADQITKLAFEWAPTNKLLHKYDPSTSPLCPRCKGEIETVSHVIRCRCLDVAKQRHLLIRNLRAKCHALKTKPGLVTLLVASLESWFERELIEWEHYPSDMHELIKNQTLIGWDQLVRGRFVLEWARMQDCYLCSLPKKARKRGLTGQRWVTAIIRVIWVHYFEIWEDRNRIVHGMCSNESMAKVKKKLLQELRLIHKDRLKYLQQDRRFLIAETKEDDRKLDEYVKHHYPSTIRNWLDWHGPLFKASIKAAHDKAVSMTRPITEFLITRTASVVTKPARKPPQPEVESSVFSGRSRSITEFFLRKFPKARTGCAQK